jgi:hypothetical protein
MPDRVSYGWCLSKYIIVPAANDIESLRTQPSVPFLVIGAFSMLRTVSFDYQAALEVYEVDDVASDNLLALELVTSKSMASEDRPKASFGLSRFAAHSLGTLQQAIAPSPCSLRELPLSRKGRGVRKSRAAHCSRHQP